MTCSDLGNLKRVLGELIDPTCLRFYFPPGFTNRSENRSNRVNTGMYSLRTRREVEGPSILTLSVGVTIPNAPHYSDNVSCGID
ncbi:MAG: hypothetical protein GPJ54_12760 [Candidatus Heimdallarchaeota archaeon]|nr:hypothetical protein [Candidatus Heimdallarchaeota archaeon]